MQQPSQTRPFPTQADQRLPPRQPHGAVADEIQGPLGPKTAERVCDWVDGSAPLHRGVQQILHPRHANAGGRSGEKRAKFEQVPRHS